MNQLSNSNQLGKLCKLNLMNKFRQRKGSQEQQVRYMFIQMGKIRVFQIPKDREQSQHKHYKKSDQLYPDNFQQHMELELMKQQGKKIPLDMALAVQVLQSNKIQPSKDCSLLKLFP